MAIDTKEEAIYFNKEKELASDRLLAEGVEELVRIMLRKAFTQGYKAKEDYDKAQEFFTKENKTKDCKCACHKTKNKEKGTCGKCYAIQCSWWKGKNFEYANREGLWIGKKERNR